MEAAAVTGGSGAAVEVVISGLAPLGVGPEVSMVVPDTVEAFGTGEDSVMLVDIFAGSVDDEFAVSTATTAGATTS